MDETLFPEDDPFEPLARLEDQLRHSRERLTEGSDGTADPADSVPARLAMEAEEAVEVVETEESQEEPEFSFEFPEMPEMPELPEFPEMPEVTEAEAPQPFEALTGMTDEDDDVWEPFPAVVAALSDGPASYSEPATTEPVVESEPISVPEQDPLVIDPRVLAARSASPAVSGEADRALAEAAKEVSWLARRVADGLDSVTGRLDEFERQLSAMSSAAASSPTAAAAPVVRPDDTDPTALEEWSMALARLVRADSNALRDEVHRIAAEQGTAMAEVHRLTEENGIRISEAVEDTIARIDTAVLRLADSIEKRLGNAISSLESAADAMRSEDQEALVRMIDDRMEALARLMRSDNERISARLEAEIGIGREVLRAAKELQASLANDVATALDQRDRMFRTSNQGQR